MTTENSAVAVERDDYIVTTASDKGAKIHCVDREGFANNALSFIDWDAADSRESARGPYKTTGQQSFYVEDLEGNSIQVNFSANLFPKERKGKGAKKEQDPGERTFKLSVGELAAVDRLIGETADMDRKVRLMTIKSLAGRGLVGLDELMFLKTCLG